MVKSLRTAGEKDSRTIEAAPRQRGHSESAGKGMDILHGRDTRVGGRWL